MPTFQQGKKAALQDLPSWQFGSHLYFSITDATLAFGGYAGAHDWVDDGS